MLSEKPSAHLDIYLSALDELSQVEISYAPIIVKIRKGLENSFKLKAVETKKKGEEQQDST